MFERNLRRLALLWAVLSALMIIAVAIGSLPLVILLILSIFLITAVLTSTGSSEAHDTSNPGLHVGAEAMQRAGYRARTLGLWLDDIGLLVYHGDRSPRIYRTSEVPTDATHIRPFVVVHTSSHVDSGKATAIQFELLDLFDTRYIATAEQVLKRGQNFITPGTWLPLNDQQPGGVWTLDVSIGQTLLGTHDFGWLQVGGQVRAQFNGDGEIDELACHLTDDQNEQVSLDELLTEQDEEVIEGSATQ